MHVYSYHSHRLSYALFFLVHVHVICFSERYMHLIVDRGNGMYDMFFGTA